MSVLIKIVALLLLGSVAFAHGMDQLGPHKGYIQMPGAFHTEVVQNKDGSFNVYLLDIEFKNPLVNKSEVTAAIQSNKKIELNCKSKSDFFHCSTSLKKSKKGELVITAVRDGVKANDAVYNLPLKLQK